MLQPSPSLRTGLLVLLVTTALVVGAATNAVGTAATQDRVVEGASVDRVEYAQQTTPVVNNSSLRHRNPDAVQSENRLDDLQRVLGGRLTDRLSESSVQLSQEQYDQARSVLGEEYLDQLEKYGDVAGERGDDNATSATETFNETRDTQREYSQTVSEFRETVSEYQEAKANGNDARARQLAREAVALGAEAERQSNRLNDSYTRLEQATETDLGEAQTQIQSVQGDVDDDRRTIAEEAFVSTTLTVRTANDEEGSFTDPVALRGQLDSEDGPVSSRQIRLAIGSQTATTTTGSDGEFTLTYRPTVIPANQSNVTVRYVPQNTSVYGGSNATVPLRIERVTAQPTLDTATDEAAFGESVEASGSLAVDGEPVAGFPLALSVDGVRVGTVRTVENGSFELEGSLPAAPRSGEQSLTVSAAVDGRAVAVDPAQSTVVVRETATNLSATVAEDASDQNATVLSGTLTAEGQPVNDQRVVVTVAGDRVGTARTDATGAYTVRVDGERGVARVAFDGRGTNLASAEASVTLPVEDAGDAATETPEATPGFFALLQSDPLAALTTPLGLVVSGLSLGLVGLAALFLLRRRSDDTPAGPPAGETPNDPDAETVESAASSPAPADPFTSAMAALEEGTTDDAVIEAYAAVRRALAAGVVSERARTHWQFFDACVAAGVAADPLRTITEAYETARYGADAPTSTLAEEAIAAARTLVEGDDTGTDAGTGTGADTAPSDD